MPARWISPGHRRWSRARCRHDTLSTSLGEPTMTTASTSRPGRGRIFDSITQTIGDPPLVRLNRLPQMQGIKAQILAKLEFFNPIGSVKDRIGVSMIKAMEAEGTLGPD